MATFDGAILQADFIPDSDMLTMQFVFSSEEYPEYVNASVNDAFGVWVERHLCAGLDFRRGQCGH